MKCYYYSWKDVVFQAAAAVTSDRFGPLSLATSFRHPKTLKNRISCDWKENGACKVAAKQLYIARRTQARHVLMYKQTITRVNCPVGNCPLYCSGGQLLSFTCSAWYNGLFLVSNCDLVIKYYGAAALFESRQLLLGYRLRHHAGIHRTQCPWSQDPPSWHWGTPFDQLSSII